MTISFQHRITIVGGGLAGLTLGIGLRRQAVPAEVWEAGHYPRHRVCGEFISGRGLRVLRQLDLLPRLETREVHWARTAAFFTDRRRLAYRPLPEPALCLSRAILDAELARRFVELDGNLMENRRWVGNANEEGIVRATGRRVRPVVKGWRWFGLKAHAVEVAMEADLELHLTPDGYIGLCRLANGVVNACGLFRSRSPEPRLQQSWRNRLSGRTDSPLHAKMRDAEFIEDSFCSVAGITLEPVRALGLSGCCLGDSLTMIPPLTGNGMSVAFETADLATSPMIAYARGEIDWKTARNRTARRCDDRLRRRLFWARLLHHGFFHPVLRNLWLWGGGHWNAAWQFLFHATR